MPTVNTPPKASEKRTMIVSGKVSDLCSVLVPHLGLEYDGYVPPGLGISDDPDYIELEIDLDTGKILDWPDLSDQELGDRLSLVDEEWDEEWAENERLIEQEEAEAQSEINKMYEEFDGSDEQFESIFVKILAHDRPTRTRIAEHEARELAQGIGEKVPDREGRIAMIQKFHNMFEVDVCFADCASWLMARRGVEL